MTKAGTPRPGPAGDTVQCQTALVTRIALFLRLLSKENFQKLLMIANSRPLYSEGELLKLMAAKGFISPKQVPELKRVCLNFARAQKDTRFGSLCIEFGFLTQSNLDLALEEQKTLSDSGRTIFLGDLLVEAGMLSRQHQKLILQKQKLNQDFQESVPDDGITEIRDRGITLFIHENGLTVTGLRNGQGAGSRTPEDLRDLLEDNGIIYGIAREPDLQRFLTEATFTATRFELACGTPPVAGTDAQIFYLFDQDYLSAGTLGENGTMDYKSRGHIPVVASGDALAEKIPAKAGRDGVNVFGDVVKAEHPLDMDISCAKGVILSEDGLQAFAATDGYPKLSSDGILSVNDAHVIQGDVDYTTGHVKFSKNVFITGSIKAGFKVEAKDVVARSVDGGIIDAQGDVSVANGMTNAVVTAAGSVSASYVHSSTIGCMGDVDVAKEVVESKIFLEGTFEMTRGKMYATTVSARGGAKIYQIGSIKAVPSSVEVGTSPHLARLLRVQDRAIEKRQRLIAENVRQTEAAKARCEAITREITQINRTAGAGKAVPADAVNAKIIALRSEQRTLDKRMKDIIQETQAHQEKITAHVEEKFALQQKVQSTPPKPILDVRGKILSGTTVRGRHASITIEKDLSRVRIMEMSGANVHIRGRKKKLWEMICTRL